MGLGGHVPKAHDPSPKVPSALSITGPVKWSLFSVLPTVISIRTGLEDRPHCIRDVKANGINVL